VSGGAGIDIVSVSRVSALLARRPQLAERAYTDGERRDCDGHPERWASRWAAKEAVRKLCGDVGLPLPAFADVEVVSGATGAPSLRLRGAPTDLQLTMSHDGDIAVALVTGVVAAWTLARVPADLRLAERPYDAHKGTFGTVVVIGGAVGMSGAPLMSATAAARGGAGKVRLCVPEPIYLAVAAQTLEVMAHPLPAGDGGLAPGALRVLLDDHLADAAAVVLGPGVGRAAGTERLVLDLLPVLRAAAVVDADALNIAAAHRFDWRRCTHPVVLTPHPAEMGRLCELSTTEVQSRRAAVALEFAARSGTVVVLKGSDTVIATPDGRVHTSEIRVVALATGGSGDVLSGLLAAFLAQGLQPFDAAVTAVFVHAEAALALQARRGRAGVLPRDLLDELPAAQERARRVLESRRPGG
jgi:NAD(P)H-hydrate epimerase